MKSSTGRPIGLPNPNRNKALEDLLTDRGIPFEFLGDVLVTDIVIDDQVQVRLGKERAPRKNVDRYATIMRSGGQFPAVVIDGENRLVDGNTRYEATKKAKRSYIAAYRVNASDDVLRLLAIELNQLNGEAMSRDAIRQQVVAYTLAHPEATVSADVWERRTGVPAREITKWIRLLGFPKKLVDAGVEGVDANTIGESLKQEFLKVPSNRLFKEVVELAVQADLSVRDVREIVRDILGKAKDSEESALNHLAERRGELKEQIASGGAFRSNPSVLRVHRLHLGYIAKLAPADVDKMTSTERAELSALVASATTALAAVSTRLSAGVAEPAA